MNRRLTSIVSLFAAISAAVPALAQTPRLTLNGVTSADNNAVAHLSKQGPLSIQLTGTPGAPFAILLSGDAFDGLPAGEMDVNTGFFLRRWIAPQVSSPIHPVFDGIGTSYIASQLGLASGDFVADVPSPLFRFDAAGKFTVSGLVPPLAFLVNQAAGGTNPLPLALESGGGGTTALYLQVVEIALPALSIRVGNGMRVVFDAVAFPGTLAYSEGQDANPTTAVVAARQTLATLTDTDFSSGAPSAPVPAPTSQFDASFQGATDLWMIALAGTHELVAASPLPNALSATIAPPDPDFSYPTLRELASGPELFAGTRPVRDNENYEFPLIQLPGNRAVFHWRNASNAASPSYGFGILHKDTAEFRNLTPAGFAFTESATRSPWEIEVGVTPDGNFMLAVLDQSIATDDRVFLFDLRKGSTFGNGLPIIEVQKPAVPDQNSFRRVWEESFSFLANGSGGWFAYFSGTDDVFDPAQYPERLFQIAVAAPGAVGPAPIKILPQAAPLDVIRLDRQPAVAPNGAVLVVTGAFDAGATEQLYAVSAPTAGGATVKNITNFTTPTVLAEWGEATDGSSGFAAFSPDGAKFAYARDTGVVQIPHCVPTTPALGNPAAVDLIGEISNGGQFALAEDFPISRDYCLTPDGNYLLFFQGSVLAFPPLKFLDLFRLRLSDRQTINLTRTISGGAETVAALLGPWDPLTTLDRPAMDEFGTFRSRDGAHLFFLGNLRPTGSPQHTLAAVELTGSGNEPPAFAMVNVSGNKFAPKFGLPKPPLFAPFLQDVSNGFALPSSSYFQVRRVAGSGPFADFYIFTARIENPVNPNAAGIDQLWLLDGGAPGPAIPLTSFAVGSSPIAGLAGGRITNPVPSASGMKIAFAFDQDGAALQTIKQDVLAIDLASFGAISRIPATATPFSRFVTRGTLRFTRSSPDGLFYATGTIARGLGPIDGIDLATDPHNPIDATAFFHRFDAPTVETKIAPDPAGSNRRAVFVYSVGGP